MYQFTLHLFFYNSVSVFSVWNAISLYESLPQSKGIQQLQNTLVLWILTWKQHHHTSKLLVLFWLTQIYQEQCRTLSGSASQVWWIAAFCVYYCKLNTRCYLSIRQKPIQTRHCGLWKWWTLVIIVCFSKIPSLTLRLHNISVAPDTQGPWRPPYYFCINYDVIIWLFKS